MHDIIAIKTNCNLQISTNGIKLALMLVLTDSKAWFCMFVREKPPKLDLCEATTNLQERGRREDRLLERGERKRARQ